MGGWGWVLAGLGGAAASWLLFQTDYFFSTKPCKVPTVDLNLVQLPIPRKWLKYEADTIYGKRQIAKAIWNDPDPHRRAEAFLFRLVCAETIGHFTEAQWQAELALIPANDTDLVTDAWTHSKLWANIIPAVWKHAILADHP